MTNGFLGFPWEAYHPTSSTSLFNLKPPKPRLGPLTQNGMMAKGAYCEEKLISAEHVRSKHQLREFCGFAASVGPPDWLISKLNGLEKWRDMRASKIECLCTGAQVSMHDSSLRRRLGVIARNFLRAYKPFAFV